MKISDIKSRLSLLSVLSHYNLKPDKNSRLKCPFHNDKTPSLQIYPKTDTCYCFSSNCRTHGKSLDVIDFIMHKEDISKHEALKKATSLITLEPVSVPSVPEPIKDVPKQKSTISTSRISFLETLFCSFKTGFAHSKSAIEYVQSRNLDFNDLELGYNGGSFHYGKDLPYITQCLEYGLLLDKNLRGHSGEKIYSVFGKNSVVFPLRNREDQIVSLYFRSIINDKDGRHYYLKDRQGLYPCYPCASTKTLILTESVIDAASLSKNINFPSSSILSLYGTNGLSDEHLQAINALKFLEEIILFFDGDEAGIQATKKYAEKFKTDYPHLKITSVEVPKDEDINSLLEGHSSGLLQHLIDTRQEISFLFSTENSVENKKFDKRVLPLVELPTAPINPSKSINPITSFAVPALNSSHPDCLLYRFKNLLFTLWGGIDIYNVNRLRATLHIRLEDNKSRSFRDTVDLYSHSQSERLIKQASEKLETSPAQLSDAVNALTSELEQYRNSQREAKQNEERIKENITKDLFSKEQLRSSLELLKNKNLNKLTHDIFGNLGLIGQQDNGMLLFFIFLTRFFKNPLHAIVMGASGSGKTHLLQGVARTVPKQHIHYTTSLSENTLYYTPKDFLRHKILLQEDLDGAYNALLPLRELMSNQSISRFSTKTNSRTGDSKQVYLQVEGPVCIAGATTKERIYEDNANRSFLIQIEDSPSHERAVLTYQGQLASGEVNPQSYEKPLNLLKAAQLQLSPFEVLIPFASQLDLPPFVFKKLRTKSHYLTLIKSVTFWNQHNRQRQSDEDGHTFLLSTVEDVKWANYLCRESLLRKSDELTGKSRNFFEALKEALLMSKKQQPLFRSVDIRVLFRLHPMQLKRYLDELESHGLISCKSRSHRFGNEYEILVWDDYKLLQSGLDILDKTVKKLEVSQGFTSVSQSKM